MAGESGERINGRPVTDTPPSNGPVWEIHFPDVNRPGHYNLFHLAIDQESHDRTVKALIKNGFTDFKEVLPNGD